MPSQSATPRYVENVRVGPCAAVATWLRTLLRRSFLQRKAQATVYCVLFDGTRITADQTDRAGGAQGLPTALHEVPGGELELCAPARDRTLLMAYSLLQAIDRGLLPDAEMHEIRRHAAREGPGHELHVLVLLQS